MSEMGETTEMSITVTRNGPYVVTGRVPLAKQTTEADAEGQSRDWQHGPEFEVAETYSLCRCGHSSHKPFCERTHLKIGFDGTEVASRVTIRPVSVERIAQRSVRGPPNRFAASSRCPH